MQETRESVQEYLTAIKHVAANWPFMPNEYGSRLRDMFALGIRDDAMLQRFYEKDYLLTQTLDQVFTFVRTVEGARKSVTHGYARDNSNAAFHYVSGLKQVPRKDKTSREMEVEYDQR